MRICKECGAHLDAGERCDCEESHAAAVAERSTAGLVEQPSSAKRKPAWMLRGAALVSEKAVG